MEFIIHPYEGIEVAGKGMIRFGMSRDEVRSFFEEEPHSFKKSKFSEMETDGYFGSSIQFSYKSPGILRGISFAPEQDPLFRDKHLLRLRYEQLKEWFLQIDPLLKIEKGEGFLSLLHGLNVWAPGDEDEQDYIAESVFIFERGYYEK
jgi:hypothetical protein